MFATFKKQTLVAFKQLQCSLSDLVRSVDWYKLADELLQDYFVFC